MVSPSRVVSPLSCLILSLLVAWGLFFPLRGTARGEGPKEERLVLSLAELIQRAIDKSPEIGEIRSDIEGARSELEQVKGAYYPQLESTAFFGPVKDAKEPEIRDGRITDPSPALSTSSIGVFGTLDLTMTQPLYTFGKLSNRKEAAFRGVRAKESRLAEKKGQIAFKVKELYYALILARGGVEAAGEAQEFYEDARKRVQRLLELNSLNVRESDMYRIEAYQADSLRFKAEAEKGVKVSHFALKSLIGLPPEAEFDLAEKEMSVRKEGLAPLESYLRKAEATRPELKQLAEAISAQEFQVKAATSDRYPSFFAALHGSLAGAPGRDVLYNSYIRDDFNHAYAGVVAGLRWTFDFGISRGKVDKMRAEYDKMKHRKAFAEMNIPVQVVKNYQDHLEWKKAAESYRKAATASRKWVLAAMSDFDMGVGTAYDLLNAIDRYGHNQGRYLEALFRYNLSLAELEYAAGLKTW
jgi:outer membrane protein